MERSHTYIATPPGETIKEQLADRNMTQKEFAARMDLSEKHVSHLLNGKVALTPDVARRLEMVLGVPADFWNRLEAIYREKLTKVKDENEMDEDMRLARNFPYGEMARNGWVPQTRDAKEKVIGLRKFFGVARLGLVEQFVPQYIAWRQLGDATKNHYALMAWIQQARWMAQEREIKPIHIKGLEKAIPQIKSLTELEMDVFSEKLINLLANYGVALVFVPYLKNSFLQGATFYDGKKYVIGMTARTGYGDIFWFSLFHELGHIILGHVGKSGGIMEADERAADYFAEDYLIAPEEMNSFIKKGDYTESAIIQFARKLGVDVGIVVGRLQKERLVKYSEFVNMKRKYTIA